MVLKIINECLNVLINSITFNENPYQSRFTDLQCLQTMINAHPYWARLTLTAHLHLYQHWQEMIPIYTQRYQCCAPACCVCYPCDRLSSHGNTSLSIRQGRPQAGFVLFLPIANIRSLHTLVFVVFFFHLFSIYLECDKLQQPAEFKCKTNDRKRKRLCFIWFCYIT